VFSWLRIANSWIFLVVDEMAFREREVIKMSSGQHDKMTVWKNGMLANGMLSKCQAVNIASRQND